MIPSKSYKIDSKAVIKKNKLCGYFPLVSARVHRNLN